MTGTTVKLKRSSSSGGVPNTSDLSLGELAVNTHDGKVFTKKNVSGTETIVTLVSSDFSGTVNATAFAGDGSQLTNLPAAGGALSLSGGSVTGDVNVSGQIGVGTTSPLRLVDINNSSHATLALTTGTSGQSSIFFADTDTNVGQISYLHQEDAMFFRIADQEQFRVDSLGNMGINNAIPGSFEAGGRNLVVGKNSTENGITIYSTTTGNIFFADGTSESAKAEGYVQYQHNNNRLDLGTSNTTQLSIDSNGNTRCVAAFQSGGNPNDGGAVGAKMLQTGVFLAARASNSGASAVYMGFLQGTSTATSRINANGSAEFSSNVIIGTDGRFDANATSDSDGVFVGRKNGTLTSQIAADGSAEFNKYIQSNRFTVKSALGTNVNGTDYAFAAFDGSSNLYAAIGTDGTAIFTQPASDQSGGAALKATGTAYGTNKAIHGYINSVNVARSLLYLENANGSVVNVTADGSAKFSSSVVAGGSESDLTGTNKNVAFLGSGPIVANRSSLTSSALSIRHNGTDKVVVKTEGSAIFGDTYKVKIRPFNGANADQFQILDTSNNVRASITGGGSGLFQGTLTVHQNINGLKAVSAAGTGTNAVLRVYSDTLSAYTTNLNADGTALFGSTVTVGGAAISGSADGVQLYPTGGIHATQASSTSTILSGYVEGSSTKNVAITAGGSATFSGNTTVGDWSYTETDKNGVELGAYGYISTQRAANSSGRFFEGYKGNQVTVAIENSGAATFSGTIQSGDYTSSSGGIAVNHAGNLTIRNDSNSANPIRLMNGGSATSDVVFNVSGIGTATFQGDVNKQANGSSRFVVQESFTRLYTGNPQSFDDYTISLNNNDGSAEFAGRLKVSNANPNSPNNIWLGLGAHGTPSKNYDFVTIGSGGGVVAGVMQDGSVSFAGGQFNVESSGATHIDSPANAAASEVFTISSNVGGDNCVLVTAGGSATFDGDVQSGGNPYTSSPVAGARLDSTGGIVIARSSGALFTGKDTDGGATTSEIFASGAATFGGSIDLTDSTVDLYSQTTNSGSKTFQLFSDIGGTKTEKVNITAAGSATFKGRILVDTSNETVSDYAGDFTNNRNGSKWQAAVVGRNRALNGPVWAGLANNFANTNAGVTSQILENGNAEFLGSVSIGGRDAAHTIDEYEEGTWTPQPRLGSTILSVGSNNGGSYTRIGRLVYLHVRVEITNKNSGSGYFTVYGLPYVQGDRQSGSSSIESANSGFGYMNNGNGFNSSNSNHVYIGTSISQNTSIISFHYIDFNNGSRIEVNGNNVTSSTSFAMDIVYQI